MGNEGRIAIYPGSFDPITRGHLDIIETCSGMFDKVIVAIMVNPSKMPYIEYYDRYTLINECINHYILNKNITVVKQNCLTVYAAKQLGAGTIVRGVRLPSEYEFELNLAINNKKLDKNINTILIPSRQEFIHISSSAVREIIRFKEFNKLNEYVPDLVAERICDMFNK